MNSRKIVDSKVYAFTNENLTSFGQIYDFDGSNVFSVLGSGDQYFISKLYGARDVVVYDNNPNTYVYFALKFYAIRVLTYEEFLSLFVETRLRDCNLLRKVLVHLPKYILTELTRLIDRNQDFSSLLLYSPLAEISRVGYSGRAIPYLERGNYYKLQEILCGCELPEFYNQSFLELPQEVRKKSFDIMLVSNVFRWLFISPKKFDRFLDLFNVGTIQAYYTWTKADATKRSFEDLGYYVNYVEPSSKCSKDKNLVFTKTK